MSQCDRKAIKFAIFFVALIMSLLCVGVAHSAEFTVDDRSAIHFTASAAIGYGADSLLFAALPKEQKTLRRSLAFGACMVPGLYKEFGRDAYADYGDILFNALGCGAGIWLGEEMWISVTEEKINVAWRW